MITLPETDPRGAKAVAIAADAGQWLKCRTRDGRKAYGIRSSRNSNEVYFVTRHSCTCYDGLRRECKHQLAVQLHCELMAEQQAESEDDKIVHLDRILSKRRPVYVEQTTASKYDDIFKRFDDDDGPRGLRKESYL